MSEYITGTNHSQTLTAALDDFFEALLRRWREEVCVEVVRGRHDYPVVIRRAISPHSHPPLWEYWSRPAREHLRFPGQCAFVSWVGAGQNGSLSAVTCDGATGTTEDVEVLDGYGRMVVVPPYIECGMGSVLAQVEQWAWGERDHLFYRLPLFDFHDVKALNVAHDALIDLGRNLALAPGEGSHSGFSGENFNPSSADDLQMIVEDVSGHSGKGLHWWAGWTGLAAARAKSTFFDSVEPTIHNQSALTGALANLYSDRAAIIEEARNNTLFLIQQATEAFGERVTTERKEVWKTVENVGDGISTVLFWSGKGAAVGATVKLIGFLGQNLDSGTWDRGFAHDVAEVVGQLNDEIDGLNSRIDGHERDYFRAASTLRSNLFNVHSYELELYDLTANNPDGDREDRDIPDDGFTAKMEDILAIAEGCYAAGNRYEELVPTVARASDADPHLADKDGNRTEADQAVQQLRDQLEGYIRTTCGRYLLAGDQVTRSAEDYAATDDAQRVEFETTMEDWEEHQVGNYDAALNPERYAEETDRSGYDPYAGHPALDGAYQPGANSEVAPGSGSDTEYIIEDND